jgi:hypothetical protein
MQNQALQLSSLLTHAKRFHPEAELVSRTVEGSIHRYGYGEAGTRTRKLATALRRNGIVPGDRIATLVMGFGSRPAPARWEQDRHRERAAFAVSHPGQALVASATGNYTCNPDYQVLQVGLLTQWTPVKNLTFSAELDWFQLYQHMSGSSVFTPSAPQPTELYQFKDQNTLAGVVRVQRNF